MVKTIEFLLLAGDLACLVLLVRAAVRGTNHAIRGALAVYLGFSFVRHVYRASIGPGDGWNLAMAAISLTALLVCFAVMRAQAPKAYADGRPDNS